MESKTCTNCKITKPLDEFSTDKTHKDGRASWCRVCGRAACKRWADNNSEMSWDNYGSYWHIDHEIPVKAFNFKTPADIDFKRCWALKNLRPLSAFHNKSKGAKVDRPFQPSLAMAI
jgi:hypothetical protein